MTTESYHSATDDAWVKAREARSALYTAIEEVPKSHGIGRWLNERAVRKAERIVQDTGEHPYMAEEIEHHLGSTALIPPSK